MSLNEQIDLLKSKEAARTVHSLFWCFSFTLALFLFSLLTAPEMLFSS